MLIDLKVAGKNILIIGGGEVGERKARKFLEAGSRITVISKDFTSGLKRLGGGGKVKLMRMDLNRSLPLISRLISRSDVVISATDDSKLNKAVVNEARKNSVLVCAVDNPSISDFHLPAIAKVGDIRIAISTEGKSPAMAKVLRKRVRKSISREDVLQVKLQDYARKFIAPRIPEARVRRNFLYKIIRDEEIKRLLQEGKFGEAKKLTKRIFERYQSRAGRGNI